jgi:hypothetical protein
VLKFTVSAIDDSSVIFGMDSEKSKPIGAKKEKQQSSARSESKAESKPIDYRKKIAELNEAHRNQILALKSKHQTEHKLLRDELTKQEKQARDALKDATEGSKKFYDAQVKQMRSDYSNQIDSVRKELKQYIEKSINAITKDYESKVAKVNDEKLESLRGMIHEDFLEALQKKTEEVDLIRVQSSEEVTKLAQENNEKSHRITQLEIKMKEISHYLPEDVQEDLCEQFGFEAELEGLEDEPKARRRGLFARLMSIF